MSTHQTLMLAIGPAEYEDVGTIDNAVELLRGFSGRVKWRDLGFTLHCDASCVEVAIFWDSNKQLAPTPLTPDERNRITRALQPPKVL